jgi:hypothetical protein
MPEPPAQPARPSPAPALAALLAALLVLVVPMTVLELTRAPVPPEAEKATALGYPSELLDQEWYHRGVIEEMAAQWPAVDLVSYDSATTPGYHLLQATLYRLTGARWPLQIANVVMGVALVSALFFATLGACGRPWLAAALAAPLLASPYTVGGSIWLTTDNLCWTFVTLTLAGAALHRFTPGRGVRLGLYATAAVLVRQIHVWPIALVGLAGALRSPLARLAPPIFRDDDLQAPRRWACLAIGAAAAAVPAIVLGVFLALWGGLLPDSDRIRVHHTDGANPASPALALACVGVVGVFCLPLAWGELRRLRAADPALWLAALGGAATALVVPTSYAPLARGGGWIWQVVARAPAPGDRSIALAAMAAVGAVCLLVLARGARRAGAGAPAAMVLLALLAWLSAQTVSTMAWQRYFDPMAMIAVPVLAGLAARGGVPRLAWAGPVALGALQAVLTLATLHAGFVRKVLESGGG